MYFKIFNAGLTSAKTLKEQMKRCGLKNFLETVAKCSNNFKISWLKKVFLMSGTPLAQEGLVVRNLLIHRLLKANESAALRRAAQVIWLICSPNPQWDWRAFPMDAVTSILQGSQSSLCCTANMETVAVVWSVCAVAVVLSPGYLSPVALIKM